jgi:hypothetical protein
MSKASIELYSALTTLGLDAQHATRAAEAVEGTDATTRIEVRAHSVLLGIIMAFMLVAIWQFMEARDRLSLLTSEQTHTASQLKTLTEAVNRIAPR